MSLQHGVYGILSSQVRMASNTNKSWDDVLNRYDIQNQDEASLLSEPVVIEHRKDSSLSSPLWATRAIFAVGCVTLLGNIPLQSHLPDQFDTQFEIALSPEPEPVKPTAAETPKQKQPTLAIASVSPISLPSFRHPPFKKSPPTEHVPANQTNVARSLEGFNDVQFFSLPKKAMETYTGHQVVNTESTWRTHTAQRYDSIGKVFNYLGQIGVLSELQKDKNISKALEQIKLGTIVRAKSLRGKLIQLAFTPDNKKSFVINRTESGKFEGEWQKKVFEVRQTRATFSVKHGLFFDGRKVQVPDDVIRQVVSVFDWDIDFSHDVRVGDQVTVVYEDIYHSGDRVGSQNLLAAEFINKGKIYRTIRHTTARGLTDYFTPEGREMKRAFIRTPVAHARVSSHFNPGRFHPVLHRIRAHKGTDFAAKRGTPIIATGDGEITHLGSRGGYGKTIILKHREGYTTLYSHMSRYKSGLKKGQVVAQGDIIGYVGSTGLATGPHLHYEFRRYNVPSNPLTVELPNSLSLTKQELKHFKQDAINMKLQLDVLHRFAMEKFDINSATGG